MSDFEIASFFLHWISHAHETSGVDEFKQTVALIKENPRFSRLPPLLRGQVEGYCMGILAVDEGIVT